MSCTGAFPSSKQKLGVTTSELGVVCGGDEEVGKVNGGHKVVEFWTNRANKEEKEERKNYKMERSPIPYSYYYIYIIRMRSRYVN
jgi:hypothetical protein